MMPDKTIYEFAVIRLVPKVEREEFINIGVLVFAKRKDYVGIKYHLNENRISIFSSEVDIDSVKRYLKAWEAICAGTPQGGKIGSLEPASRFRWLTASKSTIIQCSKVHSGLCDHPDMVLENIFDRYVT